MEGAGVREATVLRVRQVRLGNGHERARCDLGESQHWLTPKEMFGLDAMDELCDQLYMDRLGHGINAGWLGEARGKV